MNGGLSQDLETGVTGIFRSGIKTEIVLEIELGGSTEDIAMNYDMLLLSLLSFMAFHATFICLFVQARELEREV